MQHLLGVILCGGESRRMGRDKGLMPKDDMPRALYMANKLDIPVVFSINSTQLPHYSAALPGRQLITDDPDITAGGPLKGLLSVHKTFPDMDLLLLACDMPDMDDLTIEGLIGAWYAGGAEFYAYREDQFYQPLCAIYTTAGLQATLHDDSLQSLLKRGNTRPLPILEEKVFKNYN